jgi:hypothetical protein
MKNLRTGARVLICGRIALAGQFGKPDVGERFMGQLIVTRASIHGFLAFDWWHRRDEALQRLSDWQRAGKLRFKEDVLDGIERIKPIAKVKLASSPFLDTLRRLGWTEGRNIQIDYRWGGGKADPASTAELVRSAPDVIVAMGSSAVAEVKQLTSTISVEVGDAVGSGFVASAARPGGNITGFEFSQPSMGGKWLGVLKEAAPNMNRVAILFGSDSSANGALLRAAEAVAPSLGVKVAWQPCDGRRPGQECPLSSKVRSCQTERRDGPNSALRPSAGSKSRSAART